MLLVDEWLGAICLTERAAGEGRETAFRMISVATGETARSEFATFVKRLEEMA